MNVGFKLPLRQTGYKTVGFGVLFNIFDCDHQLVSMIMKL